MKIGIYGRDDTWRDRAENIVEAYIKQIIQEVKVYCFEEEKELLRESSENLENRMDVLFLDLDATAQNGIELGKLVNKQWPECQLVYFSENLNYATEVYSTVHTYFTLKQEFEERIEDIFERIFWGQRQRRKRIVFSVIGGKKITLCPGEIIYFERIKRITNIVTYDGSYEIRDKLDSIQERLPEREFLRCHNSYIVYRDAVYEKQKNCFVMRNGDTVVISRSYMKTIKEYFEEE